MKTNIFIFGLMLLLLLLEISALSWLFLFLLPANNSSTTGTGMVVMFTVGLPWTILSVPLGPIFPRDNFPGLYLLIESGLAFWLVLVLMFATSYWLYKVLKTL